MTCPDCGGANFNWATKCDHCGGILSASAVVTEQLPPPQPVEQQPAENEERARHRAFRLALAEATPKIFVTPALIAINVIIFIAMVASGVSPIDPTPDAVLRWGGTYAPLITHGEPWRVATAMFLHFGVVHLLMNMYILFGIGITVERLLGNVGFLVLYLCAGLIGSLASVVWHPGAIGAGASGAIFGVFGGLIGFLIIRRDSVPVEMVAAQSRSALLFVAANLVYGFTQPNVDLAAHLGGFLAGVPLGCALALPLVPGIGSARLRRSAFVAVMGAAMIGVATERLPVVDNWPNELKRMATLESETLNRFNELTSQLRGGRIQTGEFAAQVEADVLRPLSAERSTIMSLHLREPQKTQAGKFADYIALRVEGLKTLADGVERNDPATAREGHLKEEAALEMLEAIVPSAELAHRIAELKSAREIADAYENEMKDLVIVEKQTLERFNASVKQLQSRHVTGAQFQSSVEQSVLPPWNLKRQKLQTSSVPENQQVANKTLIDYMGLRAEAWHLIAVGVASNDPSLLKQSAVKQEAAEKLIASLGSGGNGLLPTGVSGSNSGSGATEGAITRR